MKFSVKLTLFISIMIFIVFSIGGHLMIQQNFNYALEKASRQYIKELINIRLMLEDKLANVNIETGNVTKEDLINAAMDVGQVKGIGIYDKHLTEIFSSLYINDKNIINKLVKNEMRYIVDYSDSSNIIAMYTPLYITNEENYMVSVNDISDIYIERKRQYIYFFSLDIILIIISVIVVGIFSKLITKPLKELTIVSNKIANGAYDKRTNIKSNDEIGALANSFNRMAIEIERKVNDLQASLKSKNDFVENFTHELKTPMTSIMGYADMLRSHENEPEVYIKAANYIYNESKRLNQLSFKLLDLMSLSNEYIDIKPIQASELFIENFNNELQDSVVLADKTLIQCVLKNLYNNAKNAGADIIKTTGKVVNDSYIISVCDNGSGIPKDKLNRITEPFYMVDKSRSHKKGGTGLGLTLCQQILKIHNTSLSIKSEIGVGTTVSFSLKISKYHDTT